MLFVSAARCDLIWGPPELHVKMSAAKCGDGRIWSEMFIQAHHPRGCLMHASWIHHSKAESSKNTTTRKFLRAKKIRKWYKDARVLNPAQQDQIKREHRSSKKLSYQILMIDFRQSHEGTSLQGHYLVCLESVRLDKGNCAFAQNDIAWSQRQANILVHNAHVISQQHFPPFFMFPSNILRRKWHFA